MNWSAVAAIAAIGAVIVAGVFGVVNLQLITQPRQADIQFEVDPLVGQIRENAYRTTTRYADDRPISEVITVRLWNIGNAEATNIKVNIGKNIAYNNWFDFHSAEVTISGLSSYNTDDNTAAIQVLPPGSTAEVKFNVSLQPPDYDQVIQNGDEPTFSIKVEFDEGESESATYSVSIP